MSMALLLPDLAPDVIFSIFACCDISSVVSIGQTCRSLHTLAFDKSVWLGLLDNLRRKAILDRTSNLETLSTDEMIEIVQRLITGPDTWNTQTLDSDSVADIFQKKMLHPKIRTDPGVLYRENWAKLLPSDRYVLFNNWGTLEGWNIANNTRVWTYMTDIEHAEVLEFAAEEPDIQSAVVRILLCIRTYPRNDERLNYVEVVTVDLQTGTQNCLLTARAPDSDYDNPFSYPGICGTLAMASTDSGRNQYMIVDWAAQSYFIDTTLRIALVPQHIILLNPSLDGESQIHLISNDALRTYLVRTIGGDGAMKFSPVLAEDIPKLSTFADTHMEQAFSDMHVCESPLREGNYRVWIRGTNYAAKTDGLFSCTLSLPLNEKPHWCQRSRSVESGALYYAVSYSGHSLRYEETGGYTVFSAASSPPRKPARVELPSSGDYIDVAQYGGTLTYSTHSSVVVSSWRSGKNGVANNSTIWIELRMIASKRFRRGVTPQEEAIRKGKGKSKESKRRPTTNYPGVARGLGGNGDEARPDSQEPEDSRRRSFAKNAPRAIGV
ncbi:hypothetical protein C8R45DRAFT_1078011 [Mycena sanguinolenta]|nr:hypothetical protein C8R45DRAFT_1078011 [Mycena sanguinolenta]